MPPCCPPGQARVAHSKGESGMVIQAQTGKALRIRLRHRGRGCHSFGTLKQTGRAEMAAGDPGPQSITVPWPSGNAAI